jgi:D-alanyl-D-alanine carboxypeptidase
MKTIRQLLKMLCLSASILFQPFAHASEFDVKTTQALDQLLSDFILFTGEAGLAFTIAKGDSRWGSAAGLADIKNKIPMRPDHQFLVGSQSKLMNVTIAMQLIDEGKLKLDSKLSEFVPGFPKWNDITVQQLMSMSSGIPDFLQNKLLLAQLFFNPHKQLSPIKLLEYVKNEPLRFVPGTSCNYSQSNPFLLALVIEAVTKRPLYQVLQERIAGPLHLQNTFFPSADVELPNLARGYSEVKLMARMEDLPGFLPYYFSMRRRFEDGLVDTSRFLHPALTWAAGSLVSSAEDMVTFHRALWDGKLVSPQALKTMSTMHKCDGIPTMTSFNYGAGMLETKTPFGTGIGHGGLQVGYYSSSNYIPDHGITYSIMSNYLPGQMNGILDEALMIVDKGPGPAASVGSCVLPEGYLHEHEKNLLTLRFRGPVNDENAKTLMGGIGRFFTQMGKATQHYFSVGMQAQKRGDNVIFTATGPSYSHWYKNRQVELSLPGEFAHQAEQNGLFPLEKSGAWVVVRNVVKNPSNAKLMRSCVSAVGAISKASSLYVCDPTHAATADGSMVKLFGRIDLDESKAGINNYLKLHNIERCQCYDEAGLIKSCTL